MFYKNYHDYNTWNINIFWKSSSPFTTFSNYSKISAEVNNFELKNAYTWYELLWFFSKTKSFAKKENK